MKGVSYSMAILFLLVVLVLAACSSAGPQAPPAEPIARGSLAITIGGLPAGLDAKVMVRGPNGFSQQVTNSATLSDLAPGRYLISAQEVGGDELSYRPEPTHQEVMVTSNGAATATVTYQPQDPEPDPGPEPGPDPEPDPEPEPPEIEDPSGPMFGSFVEGGVWFGMQPIYDVEEVIEHQLNVVHWFHQWSDSWNAARVASVSQSGRLPMISWEPYDRPLQAIIDGQYDAYITSWARGAKAHGSLLYIQPFPEMNGYWKPWNGDPRRFVLAWRHIVDIFRAEGASNVRWIWTPNENDNPNVPENRMENYYPGSDYVDILGVDLYNWGSEYSWSRWRSFDEMLSAPYRRITALGPQPFWVNEISSTEKGGNKGQWVREMFNTFYSGSYPRLQTMIWFDKYDSARGIDWRMQSSAGSLQAFQECLAVFGEASPRC